MKIKCENLCNYKFYQKDINNLKSSQQQNHYQFKFYICLTAEIINQISYVISLLQNKTKKILILPQLIIILIPIF